MEFRTFTTRQALAALGACFALLVLASPASAVPDGFQPQLKSETPDAVDRYLANHATHEQAVSEPTVIPYLSHGIGVEDAGSAVVLRQQPDGFQPQLHGVDPAPAVDPGFDWETTGYAAGGILAAMLLALMSTIALRERRGLTSA